MPVDRVAGWNNSILWLGLGLWLLFIPAVLFFDRQVFFELLNAVAFSVATGIVVGYAPGVWVALRQPLVELRAGDALQIGVAVGWFATAMIFGVLYYWRLTGKDPSVVDHALNALSRWILISAGFMHLAAAGSIDGMVPLKSYLRAGKMTALGLILGTAILSFWGATKGGL